MNSELVIVNGNVQINLSSETGKIDVNPEGIDVAVSAEPPIIDMVIKEQFSYQIVD